MKSYLLLLVLILGIAAGVAAMIYGPDYLGPILPKATKAVKGGIKGEVKAKRMEKDRLLVTLSAPEGAMLVTFRKKIPEIDLLVEVGDTVSLNIRNYRPFVDDPGIAMVRKPDQMKAMPQQKGPAPEVPEAKETEAMPEKPEPKAQEPKKKPEPVIKKETSIKAAPSKDAQKPAAEEAPAVTNSAL